MRSVPSELTKDRQRIAERQRQVRRLYVRDWTLHRIADKLQCGVMTVKRDLRALGISGDDVHERQRERVQRAMERRRRHVARLMADYTYEEMAQMLGVSSKTIQFDVYALTECD